MIKGFLAIIAAAILITLIVFGLFYFIGIIAWLAAVLVVGAIIAAVIIAFVVFVIAVVLFFAVFYYLAEKKPTIEPGEYRLEEGKGKHE